MTDNKKNIALVVMAFFVVGCIILLITQAPQLRAAKKAIENNDSELAKSVKALIADTAASGERARNFEVLYHSSVAQLSKVQASRDSLALIYLKIKPNTHGQIIAIARLDSTGTDSLYRANLQRFSGISR